MARQSANGLPKFSTRNGRTGTPLERFRKYQSENESITQVLGITVVREGNEVFLVRGLNIVAGEVTDHLESGLD